MTNARQHWKKEKKATPMRVKTSDEANECGQIIGGKKKTADRQLVQKVCERVRE